jgi:beta-fructofuranosidase
MRPRFHFTPQTGWINDPHGITFRDGRYHAFFQYVPDSTSWALNCHWGHAAGDDLLSLSELPIALSPGAGDDGVWTGSLVVAADDRARIFYTSVAKPNVNLGRIRVAHSVDGGWVEWSKGDVVASAPSTLDLVAFRDPFICREGEGWRMFVGASIRGGVAAAVSFTSPDLDAWTYQGVVLQRSTSTTSPVWTGALWECPQVFTMNDRWAMVTSIWEAETPYYAAYAVGSYDDGHFTAESWEQLTYGESLYAPSLFFDAEGVACLIFWLRGISDEEAGWSGAHSVPYRLHVASDVVVAAPHPDVARHRGVASVSGRVAGLAADIEWDGTGTLSIVSGGLVAAILRREQGGSIVVEVDECETVVPVDGPVRVIVDGPVLELSSAAGIFGASIRPAGFALEVLAPPGTTTVYCLE